MSVHLELHSVSKRFGGLSALTECELSVQTGHAHGVIGPNGAGKTTLFNLITGLDRPDAGTIRFEGRDIAGRRASEIAQHGIGRTFQNIRLCKNLTVLDNVRLAYDVRLRTPVVSALLDLPRHRRDEQQSIRGSRELLARFGLENDAARLPGELPYGAQRRLEIVRALALEPRLLLLDEPAAGMNAGEIDQLMVFLRGVRDELKLTLVLIEHHMQLVMGLCDHITVLDFGRRIAEGPPDDIHRNPRVIEAYLGEEVKS